MGLLGRAGEIIRAKFSALLNCAENPNETLDYSYEKQLQSLQNVKRGVADVVTAKKRLEIQTSSWSRTSSRSTRRRARRSAPAARTSRGKLSSGSQGSSSSSRISTRKCSSCRINRRSSSRARSSSPRRSSSSARRKKSSRLSTPLRRRRYVSVRPRRGSAARWITPASRSSVPRTRPTRCRLARQRSTSSLRPATSRSSAPPTPLDRELSQLASQQQVDRELEQMKTEVGRRRREEGARGGSALELAVGLGAASPATKDGSRHLS